MFSRANIEKKKRIELMRDKFLKGQLLDKEDFKAAGFNESGTKNAIIILRDNHGLDIVNICRGKSLIGWILANEIL